MNFDEALLDLLACPVTHKPLRRDANTLRTDDGSRDYSIVDGVASLLAPSAQVPAEATSAFAERYDDLMKGKAARELYGDTGLFNVGYWAPGTTDLAAACLRLFDELADLVPQHVAVAADIGCGLGGGTVRLQERLGPGARVIGVNISMAQALAARARGVRSVAVMDATRLGLADGTVDFVVAAESALHFPSRKTFFEEAFRVLKPGGVLALADQLYADPEPLGAWLLPDRSILTLEEYRRALDASGLQVDFVRDVTELTWTPYCDHLRRLFPEKQHGGVQRLQDSVAHYLLARATKP
jgi:SAM-dependent methyltransferase